MLFVEQPALSSAAKTQLDAKLTQLEKDATAEVAVVTIRRPEGDTIEDYSIKLADYLCWWCIIN